MSNGRWKQMGLLVAGLGLFVGSALAAKMCEDFPLELAGVDENGMLSFNRPFTGFGECHECLNTKSLKFRIKCETTVEKVENHSGETQKYKNDPVFTEAPVTRSIYKVKTDGSAKLTQKGQLAAPP